MVSVHIRMVGRGCPKAGSSIYLATAQDIELYARNGRQAKSDTLQLERIGNQHDCAPSREYIGVLTSARISEGMAAGIGIGAIYSSALPKISKRNTPCFLVMVRNASSRWYMFALATQI